MASAIPIAGIAVGAVKLGRLGLAAAKSGYKITSNAGNKIVNSVAKLTGNNKSVQQRVFWSGGDIARTAAENYAKQTGGTTLEMTDAAKSLQRHMNKNKLTYPQMSASWSRLSEDFARGAKGSVTVFHNAKGVRLKSIWRTVEYPILKDKNAINYRTEGIW